MLLSPRRPPVVRHPPDNRPRTNRIRGSRPPKNRPPKNRPPKNRLHKNRPPKNHPCRNEPRRNAPRDRLRYLLRNALENLRTTHRKAFKICSRKAWWSPICLPTAWALLSLPTMETCRPRAGNNHGNNHGGNRGSNNGNHNGNHRGNNNGNDRGNSNAHNHGRRFTSVLSSKEVPTPMYCGGLSTSSNTKTPTARLRLLSKRTARTALLPRTATPLRVPTPRPTRTAKVTTSTWSTTATVGQATAKPQSCRWLRKKTATKTCSRRPLFTPSYLCISPPSSLLFSPPFFLSARFC